MKFRFLFTTLAAFLLVALPVQAASDFFLVLDGISGESVDKQYPGAIEISAFSFGANQTSGTTAGGGTVGRVTFSDLSLTKRLDKASPLLYLNCANGKHLRTATLYVRKAGEKPLEYYVVKLTDVIISSVQTSGGAGEIPTESLSLNFAKIEIIYTPQRPDGTADAPVKAGWDLKQNLAL